MSYYTNGPRVFTPSDLKTTKKFSMAESVPNFTTPASGELPEGPLNTCHRSRGQYLQHTHPYTYAMLRKAEELKAARSQQTAAALPPRRPQPFPTKGGL